MAEAGPATIREALLAWLLTTLLSFAVVLFDERRASRARLARAWPRASRDMALVVFGALALPFHFARTRGEFFTRAPERHLRWWVGFGLGLLLALVIGEIAGLALEAIGVVHGRPRGV